MPYIARKRLKFGDRIINVGEPVPVTGGRNYYRMEKLGSIEWSSGTAFAPAVVSEPAAGKGQGIQINAGQPATNPIPDVEIPEGWDDQHHTQIRALARKLTDGHVPDTAAATAIIEAEIARRAAATNAPVEIPANWRSLPDAERIALASSLGSDMEIGTAEDADTIIELELEVRAANAG